MLYSMQTGRERERTPNNNKECSENMIRRQRGLTDCVDDSLSYVQETFGRTGEKVAERKA